MISKLNWKYKQQKKQKKHAPTIEYYAISVVEIPQRQTNKQTNNKIKGVKPECLFVVCFLVCLFFDAKLRNIKY